jgi:hypothetical protein
MTPSTRGHIEDGGGLTATGDPSDNLTLRSIALTGTVRIDRHDSGPALLSKLHGRALTRTRRLGGVWSLRARSRRCPKWTNVDAGWSPSANDGVPDGCWQAEHVAD